MAIPATAPAAGPNRRENTLAALAAPHSVLEAAYNTACLYAAMAQSCKSGTDDHNEMTRRAVMSLRRVVYDRDCQMERPWDWISHDPDFSCLRMSEQFNEFLDAQQLRDYPDVGCYPGRF